MEVLKDNRHSYVIREGDLVVKTVKIPRNSGFRLLTPTELVDREIEALDRLKGIGGIQRFVSRNSPDTFTTEYLQGIPLINEKDVPVEYFNLLRQKVVEYQSKGVYRINSNRRDFLIFEDNKPGIVDFGDVIFEEDFIYSSLIPLVKVYNFLRIEDLRRRYSRNYSFIGRLAKLS